MPVEHNAESEKRLKETKDKYRCNLISLVICFNQLANLFFFCYFVSNIVILAEKRAKVQKELSDIDDLYKKSQENFEDEQEDKNGVKENEGTSKLELSEKMEEDYDNNSNRGNVDETGEIKVNQNETELSNINKDKELDKDNTASDLAEKEFEPIYDE